MSLEVEAKSIHAPGAPNGGQLLSSTHQNDLKRQTTPVLINFGGSESRVEH